MFEWRLGKLFFLVRLLLTQTNLWATWKGNYLPSLPALKPSILWRYTDDMFMVWTYGKDKMKEFITHLNSSLNTIRFTHEFSDSSISFLDDTISFDNNTQISTDLFVKSTDTHQYLLHTSCHLYYVKKFIPFQPHIENTPYLFHH